MDAKSTMQLPRLTDDNFDQWHLSLRLIATAYGVPKLIVPEEQVNPDDGSAELKKTNYLIAHSMIASMDDKSRRIATGGGTDMADLVPHRMMKRLLQHHNLMSNSSDIQLRRRLYMMRWTDFSGVEEIASEIRHISRKIDFIEAKFSANRITDREMIAIMVANAPQEFTLEVSMIERERKISFEDAVEILRAREERTKFESSSSSSSNPGLVASAQSEKKKQMTCDTCGKNGHTSARCFQNRGRGNRGRGRGHGRRGRGRDGEANGASADVPLLMVTGAHGKNTSSELVINSCGTGGDVIIDSGCSRHVCGRTFRDKLTNWRTGPSIRVRVANGHTHVSSEYATLPITVKTDDGPRKIIIGEVLYVEEITNLLLSVGAMTAKGIDFTMSKDTMRMDLPNTSITIQKSPGENLYRLSVLSEASDNRVHLNDPSFSVMEQSAFGFRSTSEQIRIWHDSLGHIGQKTFIATP